MYVTNSPEITVDVAARARSVCRGSAQAEWTWWMLGPGLEAEFHGRWAASTGRRFTATRALLARAGIKTERLPLGYRGKELWFVTGELDPVEAQLWKCHAFDERDVRQYLPMLSQAGLVDVGRVAAFAQLVDMRFPPHQALEAALDGRRLDSQVLALCRELAATELDPTDALNAARAAVAL